MIQEKEIKSGKRYRAKVYSKYDKKNHYGPWRKRKKQADIDETNIKHDLQNNTYIKESLITLDEATKIYFDTVAPNELRQTTIDVEKSNYKNHLKKPFGSRQLISIKPLEIQLLWEEKKNILKNSSIIKMHTFLNKIYKTFIQWGEIKNNPLDGVKKLSPNYAKPNTWSREEVNRFLEYAKDYQSYMVFWLALHTGMRSAEILGLTWNNVDFKARSIYVTQQYIEKEKKIVHRGKTKNSLREISLTDKQMETLQQHKEKQSPKTNLVCSNTNGDFLMSRNIRRSKKKICERADLNEITLHEFRHTHGSLLAEMNSPVKHIQERLGHKDVTTTLNYYIHINESSHQKTAEEYEDFLNMK